MSLYLVPCKPRTPAPPAPCAGVTLRPRWQLGPTIYGRPAVKLAQDTLPLLASMAPVIGPLRPPYSLAYVAKGVRHWSRAFWSVPEGTAPRVPLLLDWSDRSRVIQSVRDWWRLQAHPLWLLPPMTSHAPPLVPWPAFFHPLWLEHLPVGSGYVLDTRHIAYAGLPIPLPDPVAEALRPMVCAVILADVPPRAVLTAAGWPATADPHLRRHWRPASTARWSRARWRAFAAQWADRPRLLADPQDVPWLEGHADDADD